MSHKELMIDLLRHGQTEASGRFIGSTDVSLSKDGYRAMWQAVDNQAEYDQLVSSPLQRCAAFADDYSRQKNLPLQIQNDFREYHFGNWENRRSEELWQESPQQLSAFWQQPDEYPPPNGELLMAFQQRVEAALADLIHGREEGKILLLAHGGVIRCLLAHILKMPLSAMFRLQIDYASLSRIVIHRKDGNISASVSFINQRVKP